MIILCCGYQFMLICTKKWIYINISSTEYLKFKFVTLLILSHNLKYILNIFIYYIFYIICYIFPYSISVIIDLIYQESERKLGSVKLMIRFLKHFT